MKTAYDDLLDAAKDALSRIDAAGASHKCLCEEEERPHDERCWKTVAPRLFDRDYREALRAAILRVERRRRLEIQP